ncbi:MAG: hypothetical protein U9O18_04775 [Chloroflexota bacterium]|nr:hypothetical protein [Chloroflexota bacterium]
MTEPDERRPADVTEPPPSRAGAWARLRPRSMRVAIVEALLAALLAALAWALLKGILELGPGLLAVAALGGWAIGAVLWQVRPAPLTAAVVGAIAWLMGLVLTWLVALAILPDSSRTFIERVEGTPFLDWLAPQFGLLEVAGLVVYVVAAAYGARPRS